MQSVPIGEAKNRLSEFITAIERSHERIMITRHGHPAAVLISPQDLAALEEAVDILMTTGAPGAIAEGLADLDVGRIADNDVLRARYPGR
jgi:antitoxin YefM